jgi:hypothetical protein
MFGTQTAIKWHMHPSTLQLLQTSTHNFHGQLLSHQANETHPGIFSAVQQLNSIGHIQMIKHWQQDQHEHFSSRTTAALSVIGM